MVTTRRGSPRPGRLGGILIFVTTAAVITVLMTTAAFSASVTPELVSQTSNQTCQGFARAGQTWKEIKVDPPQNGTKSDGTVSVTITNFNTKTFDWSATAGIDAVFVKAGEGGSYLYRYDDPQSASDPGELTSDTQLTSPGMGQTNQISHISFCYDVDASPSPSPSPSDTVTPTPTPTPTETESETPTPTPSTPGVTVSPTTIVTASPSVLGTKVLSNTGADVRNLILLALGLLVLGIIAYVTASRSQKTR